MPLSPGTQLGPYEIVSLIGKGGMGEVYRAHDPRLGRDVAIKVSAERFSERFEREARAVAALNHPNICTLYDVGPNYLVMEFVEGESPQGPMPLDEALKLARQIVDALEAAHEKGVIHRDLKPANIKVRPDGTVKVLDFGLAKLAGPASTSESLENSPTLTIGATQMGMILGTAAYMAPEQARGKVVDKRADIWAFGVVLYEMLTGQRLFEGEDVTETLAAVVMKHPEWDRLPPQVQPLLRRCLQKDPKNRLRDIGDAMALIQDAPAAPPVSAPAPAKMRRLWPVVAAVGIAATAALGFVHFREQPPVREVVRFLFQPDVTITTGSAFTVSPDGRKLVFAAQGSDGTTRLWLRSLDSTEVRPLAGTEVANTALPPPFWSPDSRFVAFDGGGKLKKIDINGGPAQTICDVPVAILKGSWNRDGVIIFGLNSGSGIMRVPAEGGVASPVTAMDASRGDTIHSFPEFFPDGRHFQYLIISSSAEKSGIYLGSLEAKPAEQGSRKLASTTYNAAYVPPLDSARSGHLLFRRELTLMAQPFDGRKLESSGDAVPIAEQLGSYLANAFFSVSQTGVLVYRAGGESSFRIQWLDSQGKPAGTIGDPGFWNTMVIAPDGKQAALSRVQIQSSNRDLWLLDLVRGSSTRFTFGPGLAERPVWSPDGKRVAFHWNRNGAFDLFLKLANGAGAP